MTREGRGWTILLLRRGGTESRRLEVGRRGVLISLAALVVLLLAAGLALGRWWGEARAAERVAALEGELRRLNAERGRVVELAARLEEVESSYRQIVEALGGSVARSARDLALPLPGPDRAETAHPAEDPDPARPTAWPLAEQGFITRQYGAGGDPAGHPGLDIAVPLGSYVRAAGAGRVLEAGIDSVYGRYARIAHADDVTSLYAHNSWLFVATGDSVEKRQVIALSGSTGRSTAPHLHFEIRRRGELVDPLTWVSPGR